VYEASSTPVLEAGPSSKAYLALRKGFLSSGALVAMLALLSNEECTTRRDSDQWLDEMSTRTKRSWPVSLHATEGASGRHRVAFVPENH
jgi:hypothetical protein